MKYEELYEMAAEKAMEGKYEEALEYLNKCIEIGAGDAEIWMAKGTVLLDMEKYEEALDAINKSLQIDEKNDFALALKGVALYELGDKKAGEYFDMALKINANNYTALYWKGELAGKKGDKNAEAELKGKAAFLLFAENAQGEAMNIFSEVYHSDVDLSIRYECGVAYAAMLDFILSVFDDDKKEKEYEKILQDCLKNKEKMCKSAQILLDDLMGEKREEIIVKDDRDFVFKKLMEPWYLEEVEYGEEEEN